MPRAAKKSAHVSINSDLPRMAKALKINLSQTLEQRLLEGKPGGDRGV